MAGGRLAGLLGALLLVGCAGATTAEPSPDGRFVAELSRSEPPSGPLWTLTVQVGVAGTVGSWPVGCFTDTGTGAPTDVGWTAPTTLRVRTDTAGDVTVRLLASGQPDRISQSGEALQPCPTT